MHIHVYTPMRKQCTLAHTYVYHLSAPPFVVSNLDNPWVGTISCDVDHVSSRVASVSFHPVPFSIQLLCTHTHTHTHINHLPSPSPSLHAALSHLFFLHLSPIPQRSTVSVLFSTASVYTHTHTHIRMHPPPSLSPSLHAVLSHLSFLHLSPLPQGPPSPSGGVLQLHCLQCLHHKWRPVVWLVQC